MRKKQHVADSDDDQNLSVVDGKTVGLKAVKLPITRRLIRHKSASASAVFALLFAVVGVHFIFSTHAATPPTKDPSPNNDIALIEQGNSQLMAVDRTVRIKAVKPTVQSISDETSANLLANDNAAVNTSAASLNISSNLSSQVTKRAGALANLIQTDPQQAARLILPDYVLSDLSANSSLSLEKKVTLSGTFEVFHKDGVGSTPDVYDYQVVSKSGSITDLYTNGYFPNITSGSQVSVQAYQVNNTALVLAPTNNDVTNNINAAPNAPTTPLGSLNTAVIMGTFGNDTATSLTPSSNQAMFNGSSGLESWYNEVSYGQSQLNPTFFGPYTLPETLDSYNDCPSNSDTNPGDPNSFQTQLEDAANQDLINSNPSGWSHYQRIIFEFNCYSSSYGGYAYVGEIPFTPPGSSTSFNTGLTYDFADGTTNASEEHVMAHELSHNLGNYHADAYDCQNQAFIPLDNFDIQDQGCGSVQYANPFDVLGDPSSDELYHQDALHKANAGWLSAANFPVLSTPGTYTYKILPYETPTSGVLALDIPRGPIGGGSIGSQSAFTVEYRQPIGFDSGLASGSSTCTDCNVSEGPMINYDYFIYGYGGGGDTQLIDPTTTNDDNFDQSGLLPGKTFTDPQTGISIHTVSADSTGATVTVTIPTSVDACTRNAPTITPVSTSATAAYPNPLTYTFTVKSNDSSGCSPEEYKYSHWQTPAGFDEDDNWLGNFSNSSTPDLFTLAPGASTTITTSLTPDALTTAGTYAISDGLGYIIANDSYSAVTYIPPLTATITSAPDTTPPSTPTNLSATSLGSNAIKVSWSPSTDNEGVAGYWVTDNGVYSYVTNTDNALVLNATPGAVNTISVLAYDRNFNESQNATTTVNEPAVTDTTPPSTPGNLTASATDHSISLSWSPSTDNVGVVDYEITGIEGTLNGLNSEVGESFVSANTTSVTFSGLESDYTFTIDVQAEDGAGNLSDAAAYEPNTITVSTAMPGDTAPTQVNNLYSSSGNSKAINLSWSPSSSSPGISGYYILRAVSSTGPSALIGTTKKTTFKDASLQTCQAYYYSVVAYGSSGSLSPYSNNLSESTPCTKSNSKPKIPKLDGITNGETVSGTVPISIVAKIQKPVSNGTGKGGPGGVATYYIDNQPQVYYYAEPINIDLDTTTLSNGTHTIYAFVANRDSTYSASKPITFTVNN